MGTATNFSQRHIDNRWLSPFFACMMIFAVMSPLAAEDTISHSSWDLLLKQHVMEGQVDYPAMLQTPARLEAYLGLLRQADPSRLPSREAQLAFWINAYNACVFQGVLDHSPLKSVQQVKGFFDKIRYSIAGEELTLNQIEERGRALGDWRIHFALVCASRSCPPLRSEAYVPERLDAQLGEQASSFLNDPRNGLWLGQKEGALFASKIFQWYAKDFVPNGRLKADTLFQTLRPVLAPSLATFLDQEFQKGYIRRLKFFDYDWTLNAQP